MGQAYGYVTGVPIDEAELLRVGERITSLERLFNMREGISRRDDTLPKRVMIEPMSEGPNLGLITSKDQLNEKMLNEYYEARGWEKETGKPRKYWSRAVCARNTNYAK